jgi:arabinogalactan endo-1,4-beta-galactosidase
MKTSRVLFIAIGLVLGGCSKGSNTTDAPAVTTTTTTTVNVLPTGFAKGADIGWLSEMEASGRKFYDANGTAQDCIDLLKSKGINSIRLRVWVNPATNYCNKADVVAMAIRANSKGMRLMIDFHYSDTWADPGHQAKPAAWVAYDLPTLQQAVYNHTYDVLNTLKTNGVTPEWVQVGNEVDDGFLFPTAQISTGFGANYAKLNNSGYDAVKAVNPAIKVIVHVSNGYNNSLFRYHFDSLVSNGGEFDMIGMSVYPAVTSWQTYISNLQSNMADMISRYKKPVIISEVGMDVNSPQATKDMLTALLTTTGTLGTNGIGVFYWEPEANNWNSYGLGAFDTSGKPTIAMDAFLLN